MNKFLTSNSTAMRLSRTIIQALLGVLVANADMIAGAYILDPAQRAFAVALVMAVLSPVMAEIGKHIDNGEKEEPHEADA